MIHQELPAGAQLLQIDADRQGVLGQLLGGLLERHEDARLVVFERALREKLRRQERFATAGAAAHKRGPPARQSSLGDLIEPRDPGRGLGQRVPAAHSLSRRRSRRRALGRHGFAQATVVHIAFSVIRGLRSERRLHHGEQRLRRERLAQKRHIRPR